MMRDKLFSMVRKKSFLFLVERITCYKKKFADFEFPGSLCECGLQRGGVPLSPFLSPLPCGTGCQPFRGKPISEAAPRGRSFPAERPEPRVTTYLQ